MTGPAFRGLAELAGAPVTVLTSPSGAEAARLMPGVGDVLVYEAPWMKATGPRRDAGTDFAMIEALRERRFDGAAIFTAYSQSPLPAAMLCYLADIPLRLAHCHDNPYQIHTDWVADPEPQDEIRHEVQRQIDLVTGVGARVGDPRLALEVPPSAAARVESLLAQHGLGRGEYVVIHPDSTAPSRRYPAALFAEVVRAIGRASLPIVVTGTREERELAGEVLSGADGSTVNLAGCLAFEELAAVIDGAPLLIGNNSGPVHIAAAVGTPGRRHLCTDEPATHTLGRPLPGALERCAVPVVLQERLPRRAPSLPPRCTAGRRRCSGDGTPARRVECRSQQRLPPGAALIRGR
ncbi:MAG TPA: glycosyltransferase family 9 protein [Tepidiformaceae bacterium]|nr:glycosyltransferase family 9 protein [Tepidiformaceae bacterium]